MVRMFLAGAAALALATTATAAPKAAAAKPTASAKAAPVRCTDPKTKRFVKCGTAAKTLPATASPVAVAATSKAKPGKRCRNAKGQFAKC